MEGIQASVVSSRGYYTLVTSYTVEEATVTQPEGPQAAFSVTQQTGPQSASSVTQPVELQLVFSVTYPTESAELVQVLSN